MRKIFQLKPVCGLTSWSLYHTTLKWVFNDMLAKGYPFGKPNMKSGVALRGAYRNKRNPKTEDNLIEKINENYIFHHQYFINFSSVILRQNRHNPSSFFRLSS